MKFSLRWLLLALVIMPLLVVSGLLFRAARDMIREDGDRRVVDYRKRLMAQRRRELVSLSDVAYMATRKYYDRSSPERIGEVLKSRGLEFKATLMRYYEKQKERFPRESIQQFIIDFVKAYRFDDGVGYFWINDFQPRMICHPVVPSLDGSDLSTYKDSRGTYLFNEMVGRCKADGMGFVSYRWINPKSGVEEDKLSFVFTFEPFHWIVGTGEYTSVLRRRLQKRAKEAISALRYGKNGYFWICDYKPVMVAHPTSPELVGKPLGDYVDPDGVHVFREAVKVCREKGRGFIQYKFKKPGSGKVVPKLTFVRSFKHWRWVIGTGVYLDDIDEAVRIEKARVDLQVAGLVSKFSRVAVPALLIVALLAVFLATWLVNEPLDKLIRSMRSFDNDLTMRIDGDYHFELSELVDAFNRLLSSMHEIVSNLRAVADRLSSETGDIAGAVENQAAQIQQQSAAIAEITATVEEMSASAGQVAENASTVLGKAQEAFDKSKAGAEAVSEIAAQMERISRDNEARQQDIATLDTRSREISEVMEIINDIAEQTKIIAFNAALEASGAGEAGRRFSVVAKEIRSLADTVMESTGQIERKLNEIQKVTSRLVERSRSATGGIESGLRSSKATVDVLEEMVQGASDTMTAASQISMSTRQQQTASSQVVGAMREIKESADGTSASIQKINESGRRLDELAGELRKLVASFRI